MMRPYWITVERQPTPTILNLGAGITAASEEEVRIIFAETFGDLPIVSVVVISSMDELEQNHVRPNIGNLFCKGVWFPLGYEDSN